MAVTSTQRSWERGGCRPSPPPRGRCGGRGLALPWVTPRWEGPCPPPPHSQLCLQNFRVSRLFAHHPNALFLVSKRFSLSHQQAGPAHGREESSDGFIRGTRLIPPTMASVEEHVSIRWGPAVQFLGGPPASQCMPVTLSWAWQEILERRGLVGWRRSAATVSLRNARLGGGGAFPSAGLLVFTKHLPWARPMLVAAALQSPGLTGWRGMRRGYQGPQRA